MPAPAPRASARLVRASAAALAGLALLAPLSARAQADAATGTVVIAVTDSDTQQPLQGAQISVDDNRILGVTDARGLLVVQGMNPGERVLKAKRVGYIVRNAVMNAIPGRSVTVQVAMEPEAVQVAAIEATGRSLRLQEFYERRDHHVGGYFVSREDIDRRRPHRVTEVFRGIPNVRVIQDGGRSRIRIGRAPMAALGTDCPPAFYLDGISYHGSSLDADLRPEEIEGVEVYPGTQVPARYSARNAACGVVLIWTRDQVV